MDRVLYVVTRNFGVRDKDLSDAYIGIPNLDPEIFTMIEGGLRLSKVCMREGMSISTFYSIFPQAIFPMDKVDPKWYRASMMHIAVTEERLYRLSNELKMPIMWYTQESGQKVPRLRAQYIPS